jgi:hypothetical protein
MNDVDDFDFNAADPDRDDVPPELLELEGKRVTIDGLDPKRGRWARCDGDVVIVPALFAHARRRRAESDEQA